MIALNYNVLDSAELTQVDADTYAISYNGKNFYVGEILFKIISLAKQHYTLEEILSNLETQHAVLLDETKLVAVISDCIAKLESVKRNNTTLYVYIYGKIKIINETLAGKLAEPFKALFQRFVFASLFIISFLLSVLFTISIFKNGLFNQYLDTSKSFFYILITYFFVLIAGLWHEIGHSSASVRYGVYPKEIGFGFYLVFPVFYTDVSKIWILDKYKRIMVNLGGVYFQLILNIPISLIYFFTDLGHENNLLLKTIFLANTSMFFYSLNPFLRNDGYWIYSDYFNIQNLNSNALKYPAYFYKKHFKKDNSQEIAFGNKTFKSELPLAIYSFFLTIIMSFVWIGIVVLTWHNFQLIISLFKNKLFAHMFSSWAAAFDFLKILFSCGLNIFFIVKIIQSRIPAKAAAIN